MQQLRNYIAIFQLVVLGFVMTPHEFWHAFAEHTDTCDVFIHSGSETTIGSLHQHCDILQLASPTLYHTFEIFSFDFSDVPELFQICNPENYFFSDTTFLFLRGPPSII